MKLFLCISLLISTITLSQQSFDQNEQIKGLLEHTEKTFNQVKEQSPLICKAFRLVMGQSMDDTYKHYENLAKDYLKQIPDNQSLVDYEESYMMGTKNITQEFLQKIKANKAKLKNILEKSKTPEELIKKVNDFFKDTNQSLHFILLASDNNPEHFRTATFINKMKQDPENASLIAIKNKLNNIVETYDKSLSVSEKEEVGTNSTLYENILEQYDQFIEHSYTPDYLSTTKKNTAPKGHPLHGLDDNTIKTYALDTAFKRSSNALKTSFKNFKHELEQNISKATQIQERIIQKTSKSDAESFNLDQLANKLSEPTIRSQLFKMKGTNYKINSGTIGAQELFNNGYSWPDINFLMSQGSLYFEANDLLYDHLSLSSLNHFLTVDSEHRLKTKCPKCQETFISFLALYKNKLSHNPSFRKQIMLNTLGLTPLESSFPIVPNLEGDQLNNTNLVFTLLNYRLRNPEQFDKEIIPMLKDQLTGTQKEKDNQLTSLLKLFDNAIKDTNSVLEGVQLAKTINTQLGNSAHEKNKKWEGLFTQKSQEKLKKSCNRYKNLAKVKGKIFKLLK